MAWYKWYYREPQIYCHPITFMLSKHLGILVLHSEEKGQ